MASEGIGRRMRSKSFRIAVGAVVLATVVYLSSQQKALWATVIDSKASTQESSLFTSHEETQAFGPHCKAKRNWVEVRNNKIPAADKINIWILKEMTLGKKLQSKDCPAEGSSEVYEYTNRLEPTGLRGKFLGFNFVVFFPGGKGRYANSCPIFDIRTGRRIAISKYLSATGIRAISNSACQQSPDGACERDAIKSAAFCLTDQGLRVTFPYNGSWRIPSAEVNLGSNEILNEFLLPASLKKDLALQP